ncbi:MAG: glycosyltransferase N-terminal domain-containing protein [Bacteroidales bacterium]|nr:glycosyltransferase N-terminal domain-containing protein [Bacteroidales bacterium]
MVASPFNTKAKLWLAGRKGIFKNIRAALKENEKRIWIHAASLGEFEQGRPVIEALKKGNAKLKIVLTFFSPSGYEIQKNYEFADYVFYLPIDTAGNAKKFINLIKPDFAVFIKYEFWFNYLNTLKKQNIPTYLISSIFRKDQVFFRSYGNWYRKMLKTFNWFFVQNEESKNLLQNLGYKNITVSGDTRFDRVYQIATNAKTFPLIKKFVQNQFTIVLGSSWKADEEILFDFINSDANKIKYIIAPHEIHETNIQRLAGMLKKKIVRYSKLDGNNAENADILIIDNIGILSSVYQYGHVAYIGGGFGSGIHNILEAATFGLPTLFGPNYKKFQEAIDLIDLGGAFEVNGKANATEILHKMYLDTKYYQSASNICKKYIETKRGACETITNYLLKEVTNELT